MILFETQGAAGVHVRSRSIDQFLPAKAVEVNDATGAGDTFAGEVLASLIAAPDSPLAAARQGMVQVGEMLQSRTRIFGGG